MEKFFDKISLIFGGIGLVFAGASYTAGEFVTTGVLGVVSALLLFAGMTEAKKKQ